MATEWIGNLAQDIKQKNNEAAEQYGRDQHYAGIVNLRGKEYFLTLVDCLKANVDTIRRELQGHSTASDTRLEATKAGEIRITRARFPWVDARLTHHDDTITLDYAKDPGTQGDPQLDRTTRAFAFRVAPDDSLFVEDAFAVQPDRYDKPDELARKITEILFAV